MNTITTLFFDIGGVCLTNGWDHEQRQQIAKEFDFDYPSFDSRHRQVVDALERGELTLDEYLHWTVFYESRAFTPDDLTTAIKKLSRPFADTLQLVGAVQRTQRYLLATINNESRELNQYRIATFGLNKLFTAFFTSCYMGLLKPQPEHYRRALQMTYRTPDECVYIDDRPMNVEVACILGMHGLHFSSAAQLETDLKAAGITF